MFRNSLLAVLIVLTISTGITADKDNTLANKMLFGGFAAVLSLVITWED